MSMDHRRKWDREEYERKAQERLLLEKEEETKGKRKVPRFPDEPKVKRELLKAREYKVYFQLLRFKNFFSKASLTDFL